MEEDGCSLLAGRKQLVATQNTIIAPKTADLQSKRAERGEFAGHSRDQSERGALEMINSGSWIGSSDHLPIALNIKVERITDTDTAKRRTSKKILNNP